MIEKGAEVEHAEFGVGSVVSRFGGIATVSFFGDMIDVDVNDLRLRIESKSILTVQQGEREFSDLTFRKALEAINLGVVPTDSQLLIDTTIGGKKIAGEIETQLNNANSHGACRIFTGYYGSGKSHHLSVVKAVALRDGWVTASLELDPKASDPAKPATVYQGLVASLEFPERQDGSRNDDFFDLVKEIHDNWLKIRLLPYFRRSPWFYQAIRVLRHYTHRRDDMEYVASVNWLSAQIRLIGPIRRLCRIAGIKEKIPLLPHTKNNGVVYAYNLVVLHEVLKALGYKGLAIIVDEVEHIRSYAINRYIYARNFFDVLVRCSHPPRNDLSYPADDFRHFNLPHFWREGPHFALFLGLTESIADHREKTLPILRLLTQRKSDGHRLSPPDADSYKLWLLEFLNNAANRLGSRMHELRNVETRERLADTLRYSFRRVPRHDLVLREWTKLAGLIPAILMSSERDIGADELVNHIAIAAKQVSDQQKGSDK